MVMKTIPWNVVAVKDVCDAMDIEPLSYYRRHHSDADVGFIAREYEYADRVTNRCAIHVKYF